MYDRVMILEIKEDYCLALADDGQILRIKKKGRLQEGDRIYVLSEDLCGPPVKEKPGRKPVVKIPRKTMNAIVAVAAALLLCISALVVPRVTDKAYAVISVDSSTSLQMEVDKNYKVLKAVSYGDSISREELDGFEGRSMEEVEQILTPGTETILVGYALEIERNAEQEKQIKGYLENLFKDYSALYLKGSKEDVHRAEKEKQSLGLYIAGRAVTEDQIEEIFSGMPKAEALDLLRKQPGLMNNENVKKALEKADKKEKANSKAGRNKDDSDDEGAAAGGTGGTDDADDDEDDYDDGDEDDRAKAPAKAPTKTARPTSGTGKSKQPTSAPQKSDDSDDSDDDFDSDDADDEPEEEAD